MRISDWSSDVCSSDLRLAAGMGHRAVMGIADGLGVFPQRARLVFGLAWLPLLLARRHLPGRNIDAEDALDRIDGDDVAILDQTDRAADRRLGPDKIGRASCRERVCQYV